MRSIRSLFRKHAVRWIGGVALLVLALAFLIRSRPTAVETVAVERRDLERTLVLVGRVRPPGRAALGASIPGTVRAVAVREGDRVARGDLLLRLDDREARAAVAQAEAALTEARASTTSILEQAEREAAEAERDLARVRAVFPTGGVARQQLEQAERRAADAVSRLEAARAGIGGEGAGGADGEEGTGGGSTAVVERAVAALEAARARLALTTVTSPAEGVVLARSVEPGDVVQAGRVLLEVSHEGPLELVVFPSEENLESLRPGARALASADAYPDSLFEARVALVVPTVDPAQGTVEVRLAVSDPPAYLLPSMTVSVNLEAGRREAAAVLPEEAVYGLGTDTPWVAVVREGHLARQPVEVGLRAERWIEILSGVGEGDEVVTGPGDLPPMGARVRVQAPADPSR